MIEAGDLVRVKARNDVRVLGSGAFLVLKKQHTTRRTKKEKGDLVLCTQGSKRRWFWLESLEKL